MASPSCEQLRSTPSRRRRAPRSAGVGFSTNRRRTQLCRSAGRTVEFTFETSADVVRLRTPAWQVTCGRIPDSTFTAATAAVVESATDAEATIDVRYAERRVTPGRDGAPKMRSRARREDRSPEPARARSRSGTPTCWIRHGPGSSHRISVRPPTIRTNEHRVRSVLHLDSVLLPPDTHRRIDQWLVRRQRIPRALRLHATRRVPHPLRRWPVHRVHLRRAADARDPRALHPSHRPHGDPTDVVPRLSPMPMGKVHAGCCRAARADFSDHDVPCDTQASTSTWTATECSREHDVS